jgi:outer membrane protein OmpA-like peptidoglycan-associated protein
MRNRFLLAALTLVAVLPTLAPAQDMAARREGSWEFSVGGGAMYLDGALAGFLGRTGFADNSATPSRLAPAAAVRLGYNFSNNLGFSIGTGGATGSGVKYLIPFAAFTYTVDLNATTSPFFTGGTQFTRITGNGRVTHPTWGAHAGLGVRHMVSENLALRLEGRMGFEHYEELPGRKTAYNTIATLGISYFTAGRRPPPLAMAAPSCPQCARARVDTVRIYAPAPPPPPHKCEHGMAPTGAKTDQYGCLVLRDTLLLEAVHFDFDKSDITPTANVILDRVAESMLAHPELYFEIAGHTDSVGTFAYNFLLSARRANAVRNYLIRQGVPAYRMTAVGYGMGFPIAPNATVEGRALNRRGIEIRVLGPP